MISNLIYELIVYGVEKGLIDKEDEVYVVNKLIELFQVDDYMVSDKFIQVIDERSGADGSTRSVHEILEDMMDYAFEKGIMEDDTITTKDLFDTKIMGLITPAPSVIRREIRDRYSISPKDATDYYYDFSIATNYIRKDRIEKDEKWVTDTEYGPIDITINLSKPEKDPRDIAKAGQVKKSGYPACLLCKENEGYAGNMNHPARGNHRIMPITLDGQAYFLQYSPYVYYNEHCIIFNAEHTPMKIDHAVFRKILDFVRQYPHYMAGSNADLPIVGGSILSHDHFQGGGYVFAMAKAEYETLFEIPGFEELKAGIIKWPMSVIRLQGDDISRMADAADYILTKWRAYTDENAFIFAETKGTPHNTITPIARMKDGKYELDLVLRNNITTEDAPWGLYHPSADLHHIKKENIGLIEVMGLAVLPSRLKSEMADLAEMILKGEDIRSNEELNKHADWVDEWKDSYELSAANIMDVIHDEISKVFIKVLECAGVYKRNDEGQAAFMRFIDSL